MTDSNSVDKTNRDKYCIQIEAAVKCLPKMERILIRARYMDKDADYLTDREGYVSRIKPSISSNTYSNIRWKAFKKNGVLFKSK